MTLKVSTFPEPNEIYPGSVPEAREEIPGASIYISLFPLQPQTWHTEIVNQLLLVL